MYGTLNLRVKELVLHNVIPSEPMYLLIKLPPTNLSRTESLAPNKKGKYFFNEVKTFDLDDTNNVKDLFIEAWAGETCLGELRMTLYDASNKVQGSEHLILNDQVVGDIVMEATIDHTHREKDKPHR